MQMHIMKSLSEFVRDKRKEVNLTQEEFAERALPLRLSGK